MKVRRVSISNFRGVRSGSVLLDTRSLLVGGNAVGKSTVCEALDLVLGLERLYRRPVIDEYDFHQALYRGGEPGGADSPPEVRIEVVLTDLSAEAQRRFAGHVRPWSAELNDFAPPADMADAGSGVTAAAGQRECRPRRRRVVPAGGVPGPVQPRRGRLRGEHVLRPPAAARE